MSLLASGPKNQILLQRHKETEREFFRRRLLTYIGKLENGYYEDYTFMKSINMNQIIFYNKKKMRKNGVYIMFRDIMEDEIYKYEKRKAQKIYKLLK